MVYVYVDVLCVKIRIGFPELCGRMGKGRGCCVCVDVNNCACYFTRFY